MAQQVWLVKEPSLPKTVSAKQRSRFAVLSQVHVMLISARQPKNGLGGSEQLNSCNQTLHFLDDLILPHVPVLCLRSVIVQLDMPSLMMLIEFENEDLKSLIRKGSKLKISVL
jgi:hypothetical protein